MINVILWEVSTNQEVTVVQRQSYVPSWQGRHLFTGKPWISLTGSYRSLSSLRLHSDRGGSLCEADLPEAMLAVNKPHVPALPPPLLDEYAYMSGGSICATSYSPEWHCPFYSLINARARHEGPWRSSRPALGNLGLIRLQEERLSPGATPSL